MIFHSCGGSVKTLQYQLTESCRTQADLMAVNSSFRGLRKTVREQLLSHFRSILLLVACEQ